MVSKLIRHASLPPMECSQVLFDCGGIVTPDRLETVLRAMFPEMRVLEKRTRLTVPSTLRTSRQRFPERKSPLPARKVYEADLEVKQADTSEDNDRAELDTLLDEDDVIWEESGRL